MPDNRIALAEELERLKNDVLAAPAYSCMADGARDVLARLVIDNLPTIEAALRADHDAGGAVAEIRAELPESLRDGQVKHGVRLLRMGHDAQREKETRWFRAICLLPPFVDRAAGEGLGWSEDGDSPRMDAADICVSVAEALGCELGDPAMMALLEKGQAEVRTLTSKEGSIC